MKTLVSFTLFAAIASQAAGCIIFSDDDGTSGLGEIQVTWSLKSTDGQGNTIAAGCPAGATSATLFALPDGAPPSSAFQDKYDCTDGRGTIADLDPGNYTVWVDLTDTSGATLFAESASQEVSVFSDSAATAANDIYVDRGFFLVGWNLTGSANRCTAVQNDGVSILATTSGGSSGFETLVDCTEGEGHETVSEPVPSALGGAATYTVAIALLRNVAPPGMPEDLRSIGDAPDQPNHTLDYGNKLEDLGIVPINVR
ncbi:MAG TPA: hypothetical protein VHE35_23615 [Kofleriaceae bacterium]|nr:hypothetical protein [Kofleriaceae bacterium]